MENEEKLKLALQAIPGAVVTGSIDNLAKNFSITGVNVEWDSLVGTFVYVPGIKPARYVMDTQRWESHKGAADMFFFITHDWRVTYLLLEEADNIGSWDCRWYPFFDVHDAENFADYVRMLLANPAEMKSGDKKPCLVGEVVKELYYPEIKFEQNGIRLTGRALAVSELHKVLDQIKTFASKNDFSKEVPGWQALLNEARGDDELYRSVGGSLAHKYSRLIAHALWSSPAAYGAFCQAVKTNGIDLNGKNGALLAVLGGGAPNYIGDYLSDPISWMEAVPLFMACSSEHSPIFISQMIAYEVPEAFYEAFGRYAAHGKKEALEKIKIHLPPKDYQVRNWVEHEYERAELKELLGKAWQPVKNYADMRKKLRASIVVYREAARKIGGAKS